MTGDGQDTVSGYLRSRDELRSRTEGSRVELRHAEEIAKAAAGIDESLRPLVACRELVTGLISDLRKGREVSSYDLGKLRDNCDDAVSLLIASVKLLRPTQ